MQGNNSNNDNYSSGSNNDNNYNNTSTGSRPACASCKHQRKRCHPNCLLAPFFPAEKTREFQAVHDVFGVSNATKMVRRAREEDRKYVVASLIWEASWRKNDPVFGPLREYRRVVEQLKRLELHITRSLIHNQNNNPNLNQTQLVQFNGQPRGPPMYRPYGWNNVGTSNNGMHLNGVGVGGGGEFMAKSNMLNFRHDSGNMMVDQFTGYPTKDFVQSLEESRKGNIGAPFLQLQQNQNHHQFNRINPPQLYCPGQFDSNIGKITENAEWQGRP